MGRPKGFSRESVLQKAMPVFWKRGFADATLQDLEHATGVNKSGLYTEFKDKEDLFVSSLKYYLQSSGSEEMLTAKPLGWSNVQHFLEIGLHCEDGLHGCFSVNSMREVAVLPQEAADIIAESQERLKRLLIRNIKAELPNANASSLADTILTFFSGINIEQNLYTGRAAILRRIGGFMQLLRGLR